VFQWSLVLTEGWTGCSKSRRTRGRDQRGRAHPRARQRSGWSGLGRKWPLVIVQFDDSLHGKVGKRIREVRQEERKRTGGKEARDSPSTSESSGEACRYGGSPTSDFVD
jgi:hypothetical protein